MPRFSERDAWALVLISSAIDPGTLATVTSSVLETTPSYGHGLTVYGVGLTDASQEDVDLIASSSATVTL